MLLPEQTRHSCEAACELRSRKLSTHLFSLLLPPPDPTFIHAHLIPDSGEKNDDKLYFFFREKASEVGQSPMTQSRIGRICLVS